MSDPTETLVQIKTPRGQAGVILFRGACVRAAPIMRWALGQKAADLSAALKRRGWPATQKTIAMGALVSLGDLDE